MYHFTVYEGNACFHAQTPPSLRVSSSFYRGGVGTFS